MKINNYIEFMKNNKFDANKIPASYSKELRELIPILLNIDPLLRENCTKLLEREIFQQFTFKRRIMYYSTGDKYDGEYKNGMRNGKGILYSNDGSRYEGKWINDVKDGKGISYSNDGTETHEEWSEGKLNNKL